MLNNIAINTLFAQSVIHRHVDGSIHVDSIDEPRTVLIRHPYGMSFLCGQSDNRVFNNSLNDYLINEKSNRLGFEYLQVFPESWYNRISQMLGQHLIKMESSNPLQIENNVNNDSLVRQVQRINFVFDPVKFESNKNDHTPLQQKITKLNREIFLDFDGSVVPRFFWNNADDFAKKAIGFALWIQGRVASVAFASFLVGRQLEIGVETLEKYRGRGLGRIVCSHLIDFCLQKGFTPVWACHSENSPSKHLALNLGFVPSLMVPYYKLATMAN